MKKKIVRISIYLLLLIFLFTFTFEAKHKDKIYPGVFIAGQSFGGKTKQEVARFFETKNQRIEKVEISFSYEESVITTNAKKLSLGFDSQLLSEQAYSLGRSKDLVSSLSMKIRALLGETFVLSPSYTYSQEAVEEVLLPLAKTINIESVDALFNFQNGRVVAFRPSSNGQGIDMDKLKNEFSAKLPSIIRGENITIAIPIKIKQAKVQTEDANNLGIKELIGIGSSRFVGSITNRIHNITLAASRINGVLVAPGEIFSFNLALGDVSKFTGYKEAFVISGGKTVLGDGGGVCQVSTTLFRAILNSGLPILERHAHSYRVGYYEQDSAAGFDATVYAPTVDLEFKNDTQNHVLIQAYTNRSNSTLTFYLYGTGDARKVKLTSPVITNEVAAPQPQYNDDPTLPRGTVKQIDFAANGANVSFSRTVEKDGKTIISETFRSNFRPWQAVYLRGTKEN